MIRREIEKAIIEASRKIPVVVITGPRQSGKTTLVKNIFPDYHYANLEFPDIRDFAKNDPRSFLKQNEHGIIIDEVQHVPELFSYIQGIADDQKRNGMFILTGSQNFSLLTSVSQSLAGRVIIFNLLPLSISELDKAGKLPKKYEEIIFKGFYPRIYDQKLDSYIWLQSYIQTYLERDVRQIINVKDLGKFQLLLRLCAGRTGQLVNYNALANEVGVDNKTIKSWISILETSFVIFLLPPYFKNFNKRLVKTPKLYFYDTGLVCALLEIRSLTQLDNHFLKGALFENMIISEFHKIRYNEGIRQMFYFWRDNTGNEIDCVFENDAEIIPVEIKSSRTFNSSFIKGLKYWSKISETNTNSYLVYGGDDNQKRERIQILNWKKLKAIFN